MSAVVPADIVVGERVCEECRTASTIKYDHRRGTYVCTRCGLVAESRAIDEGQEWRTFEKDDKSKGPNRAGGKDDMLLGEAGLGTIVGADGGDTSGFARYNRQNESTLTRVLIAGFSEIQRLSARLQLNGALVRGAKELFKRVEESKTKMGRSREIVVVACIYGACKQAGLGRSIREVCRIADVDTRSVSRTYRKMDRHSLVDKPKSRKSEGSAVTYIPRYCSTLNLPPVVVSAAQDIAKNVRKLSIMTGKQPATVAGACIMLALKVLPHQGRRSFIQISTATEMAPSTINAAYREIYRERERLVPDTYASAEQLRAMDVGYRAPSAAAAAAAAAPSAAEVKAEVKAELAAAAAAPRAPPPKALAPPAGAVLRRPAAVKSERIE